jgi:hypothetical protein
MKRSLLLFIVLLTGSISYCQAFNEPVIPVISPGAYSSQFSNVFSFTANQASLASLKNTSVGVYNEKRFLLPGLSEFLAAFGLVTTYGNFATVIKYAGAALYNETKFGFAHARKIGKTFDLGVQINYHRVSIAEYGVASAIGIEIGSLFHLSNDWCAGIHLTNPVSNRFGIDKKEKLPSVYTMGLGYRASDLVATSMEIIKQEDQPVQVNTSVSYQFLPEVLAKIGLATATSSLWTAIGFARKAYQLELSAAYHPQLGISPALLIIFDFKNDPKKQQSDE